MKNIVQRILCIGYDWKTVTCSSLLTLILLLYIPVTASLFHTDVYLLVDRTTYYSIFEIESHFIRDFSLAAICILFTLWIFFTISSRIGIIGSFVLSAAVLSSFIAGYALLLQLIAICSIPFIVTFIIIRSVLKYDFDLWIKNRLTINYLAIIGTCLALISIYLSLSGNSLISAISIADPWLWFYTILSYFSPLIMFLCIFSVFIGYFVRFILYRVNLINLLHLDFDYHWRIPSHSRYVIIFMLLSIVMISIPHFNPAREDHTNMSVDIIYYEKWISELQNSSNLTEFLSNLFVTISGGDRPLTLLLLLLIVNIIPEHTSSLLELVLPTILAPCLVLVMFLLTKELTRNANIALLCSFLTVFSFQVLVGTYAGYYANWIGLIIMYLSLFFLLKYVRNPGNVQMLAVYTVLTILLMLVHSYTSTILLVFTLGFIIVLHLKRLISNRILITICLILVSLLLLDMIKSNFGLGRGAIGSDLFTLDRTGSGVEQLEIRWSNLVRTVQVYVGGIYGNIFFLSIALLGSMLLYQNRHYTNYFILVFLSLGILPLFFGNREIIARFFYDIPFQIPAAISLFWLNRHGFVGSLVTITTIILIVAASVRIVTNF
jgi:hypothetical protein